MLKVCNGFLNTVEATFPQYIEEMKGIADGSEISFEEVTTSLYFTYQKLNSMCVDMRSDLSFIIFRFF